MKTIEEKLNEMEQRHAAEIKALRDELDKKKDHIFSEGDPILGGLLSVAAYGRGERLVVIDVYKDRFAFGDKQIKQIKAIEDIITAARTCSLVDINFAFKEAEKLGLKF